VGEPVLVRGGRVLRTPGSIAEPLDLLIAPSGHIKSIAPSLEAPPGAKVINAEGRLIVPGLVDLHQHLDKSRTRGIARNLSGTLTGASAAYGELAKSATKRAIFDRAKRTLSLCASHGTVAIRTHTNIEPQTKLRGIEALLELREQSTTTTRLQVVAHVTSEATSMLPQSRDWLLSAVSEGVDAIGGVPNYSDTPEKFLHLLFEVAERSGLPLDVHIDEHLNQSGALLNSLIDLTHAYGLSGRVIAGHCSVLSALPPADARHLMVRLAEAGIGVVTLPAANLFLQGRDASRLPPLGLTRVSELLESGVKVAIGSDNIQDPFVPVGSGDLLEAARWTFLAGHLPFDALPQLFQMVTSVPAALMGLTDWGVHEGARADLLILDAESPEDLVATGSLDSSVMVAGRIVSETKTQIHDSPVTLS
jgi:cytosine deaminase